MSKHLIRGTDFKLPGQIARYSGKVRDVYDLGDKLIMVSTDRYSAFDRNLALVPDKGQLLTEITKWWFDKTKSIVKNHLISSPDPNVLVCKKYQVLPIEMIVRGYITGVTNTSLWHTYSNGKRDYGEFSLPDDLRKNQKLPEPVVTPTTKFEEHDRNLTPAQAIKEELIDEKTFNQAKEIALNLFKFGQKTADRKGLILVDTKYEFGLDKEGELVLIDEIHTPDSSRYWLEETYEDKISRGEEPDNYDKEYLRLWFKKKFDPYKDTEVPEPPTKIINELSRRYKFVYESLSSEGFTHRKSGNNVSQIEENLLKYLAENNG